MFRCQLLYKHTVYGLPAGNQLAALRIYCAIGDWQAAEELVADSQHPAAAFHLARLYEAHEKVADALRCFTISKRYSHGARLAKRCVSCRK